jgi:integrase
MTSFLGEWLDTRLHDYKNPEVRATTFDTYETLIRRHLKPALGHILLKDRRPEHLQRFYNAKVQAGRVRGPGGLNPREAYQDQGLVFYVVKTIFQEPMSTANSLTFMGL